MNKWPYCSFQATSEQNCSYQSPESPDFRSPKTKFRLQCADYNRCEGHLTGILPLFFLFKLFSMEIENFDKTRVKFLVEIKRDIFRFNSMSGHDAKS